LSVNTKNDFEEKPRLLFPEIGKRQINPITFSSSNFFVDSPKGHYANIANESYFLNSKKISNDGIFTPDSMNHINHDFQSKINEKSSS
jgi:hypothetical protein